jgi:hypothetical protein
MIRNVQAPLLQAGGRQGMGTGFAGWKRALRERIADAYRNAASPAHEVVPADAPAVWFSDRASLQAALIRDILSGEATHRWWWHAFLRVSPGLPSDQRIHRILLEHPREVPAILRLVSANVDLLENLARWSHPQHRDVLLGMIEAFAIGSSPVVNAIKRLELIRRADRQETDATEGPRARGTPPGSDLERRRALASLLVGVAAALATRPTDRAVREVLEKWSGELDAGHTSGSPSERGAVSPTPTALGFVAAPSERAADENIEPAAGSTPGEQGRGYPKPEADSSESPADRRPEVEHIAGIPPGARSTGQISADDAASSDVVVGRSAGTSDVASRTVVGKEPEEVPPHDLYPEPSAGIETSLGGIFYIAHLMDEMRLPEAFEANWGLETQPGWWGTLEILARGLLHSADASDALWGALAVLGGREAGDPPPSHGTIPQSPILPAGWPSSADTASEKQLAALAADGLPEKWKAWLAFVLPGVRASIRRRFAAAPFEAPDADDLLRLRARVLVTLTHVDIFARLDDISLAARLAGLDRDPGWVPRAGRVIRFHFV